MKVLYIGHYTPGCTTYMRGEHLKSIIKPDIFTVVDIDISHRKHSRLSRSIGWRFKLGPLIRDINLQIREEMVGTDFDLVWVDKGVFVDPGLLAELKNGGSTLVHYTPDTAFFHNRSRLFYQGLPFYDHCITTKSFEIENYTSAGAKHVLFCTQGFDPLLHMPCHSPAEKEGVVFVGHNEPSREEVIAALLEKNIPVKLAGARWEKFARKYEGNSLQYVGQGLFDKAYAAFISGGLIGLGLLSKKFPELHTTRTLEIPACGTMLATEKNAETAAFYEDDEVLFFKDVRDLVEKLQYIIANPGAANEIAARGRAKVLAGAYDYSSILEKLVQQMDITNNGNKN